MGDQKRFDMILGKQRARAKLREFIKTHLPSRKNAKVVCLPGENGREIEHVYRKLGFQDENIIGVESDLSSVSAIRSHYPKIQVFPGSVSEWAEDYDGEPLSVVSLDYCGVFTNVKVVPIARLLASHSLERRFVVATNFFAGREKGQAMDDLKDCLKSAQKGLDAYRDSRGIDLGRIEPTAHNMRELAIGGAAFHMIYTAAPFGMMMSENFWQRVGLRCDEVVARIVQQMKMTTVTAPGVTTDGLLDEFAKNMVKAYVYRILMLPVPIGVECYSYINDKGHRMDCDFIAFNFVDETAESTLVRFDGDDFILDPQPSNFRSVEGYLHFVLTQIQPRLGGRRRLYDMIEEGRRLADKKRINLGGGAIPFDSERTKVRVVKMLKKGRTDDEIMSRCPVTVGTLRAIKANITMGRL